MTNVFVHFLALVRDGVVGGHLRARLRHLPAGDVARAGVDVEVLTVAAHVLAASRQKGLVTVGERVVVFCPAKQNSRRSPVE